MAGYLNQGINDGIINHVSGASAVISQPGTHVFNTPSGVTSVITLAAGVFGSNGLNPAIKIVDQQGTFADSAVLLSGATGSGYTFNGADTLSLATAYKVYTGVIYSGLNFITE